MEPLRSGDPVEVGQYEIEGRLGSGGMGTVYLGRTPGGRPVAVKVLSPLRELDPDTVERFEREADILGRVRSAYSTTLIDSRLTAPPFWMVTEYIPGPTVATKIERDGPLPADECLRLMAALAEGLGDIHGYGIFHRDVKPRNIVLSPTGPRLIDFGIARGPAQDRLTETGMTVGTPHYTAPELFDDAELTAAADVFGLGATMAYAATGRRPYGAGTVESVFKRMYFEEIDCAGVEPDLAALIKACTQRDPGSRPDVGEIIERCRRALSGGTAFIPPAAVPPGTAPAGPADRAGAAAFSAGGGDRAGADDRAGAPVAAGGQPAPVAAGGRPAGGGGPRRAGVVAAALLAVLVLLVGGGVLLQRDREPDGAAMVDPSVAVPADLFRPAESPVPGPEPASAAATGRPRPPARSRPSPSASPRSTKPRPPASTKSTHAAGPRTGKITGGSGWCADNNSSVTEDGNRLQLVPCNDTEAQRWTVRTDDRLEVQGKCMTVQGDATADGSRVVLRTCGSAASQIWRARSDGTLRNPVSGRCLDVLADNDTALILEDCVGRPSQRWHLP